MHTHTLEVTDAQLELLHASLNTWINSFSHDEPDLLRAGKELRAKIDAERRVPAGVGGPPAEGDTTFAQ
jgi:hypothetical protein